ncbi:MAG: TVP38/TMEM64 family protein [Deltaproteobacteria bacterium]|nr:TVP38/TMEM64 family protein [Deltaproteobacteria bacterium]MBI3016789.1 TVP38/TMEM64 family protein [Deltaproteobacteria bacterium]
MKNKKNIVIAVVILALIAIYFLTPFKHIFTQSNIESIKQWILQKGPLAPVFFILLYGMATVIFIPGSILTLLGGLIFGVSYGTIFVLIGANIGALACFFIARRLGRKTIQGWLHSKTEKLEKKIKSHGFYVVFWLRIIPTFPFPVLNYALGLTSVTFKDYALASLLGIIPGTFVYVSLGNAASHVSLSDPKVWAEPQVWGPFLLVILLSFIPKLFKKKQKELENLADE